MKTPSESPSLDQNRTLRLLASAVALVLFGIGSFSCSSRHPTGVATAHSSGVVVEYDLPIDYLSGKYRQLYRTDPHWFHNHYQEGQSGTYYGK